MDFTFRRQYRGRLKGIILDWAGTAVDHGCMAPAGVFVSIFEKFGVQISMEEARGPMGLFKKDHIRMVSRLPEVAGRWRDAHGRPCTEEDVERMFQAFIPLQLNCIADFADPVPGCVRAVERFRKRSLKIGSSTGYTREMMDVLVPEARKRGYEPDAAVCVSDVAAGRPAPWMAFRNAEILGIYPMEAIVKIGDTVPDIEEGLNAGMWTIGVTKTGNEIGLGADEIKKIKPSELAVKLSAAEAKFLRAGAHYVAEGIADCDPVLDVIEERLARGERP